MNIHTNEKNAHLHNAPLLPIEPGQPSDSSADSVDSNSTDLQPLENSSAQNPVLAQDPLPARSIACPFIHPALRERKFRAVSFVSRLTPEQYNLLSVWLLSDDSIEKIRQRVAAPAPDGFGMNVSATSLYRLRKLFENTQAVVCAKSAVETAQDVHDSGDAAHIELLQESLSLLLYARVVNPPGVKPNPKR